MPFFWAEVERELGAALLELGERERGTAHLEEAVTACREALKELRGEGEQFRWRREQIQNRIGAALSTLSARADNAAYFKEAVVAYRSILDESGGVGGLRCARSTGSEGVALRRQAELSGDLSVAQQALARITAAFERCSDTKSPHASYYNAQLSAARALVKRLRKN